MCEFRENLTMYGVLCPSKEDRKKIKKKEMSPARDEEIELEMPSKKKKVGYFIM